MNLLLDQNISHRLIERIKDIFPEARQVKQLNLQDSTDREIWEFARDNDFTIVTFDSDFYDFSLVWGHPPKIIWIRTGNSTTTEIERIIRSHHATILNFSQDQGLACLEIVNKNS